MTRPLSRAAFLAAYDLEDWRVLGQAVETWFVAPTFSAAGAFVAVVAREADEADHHPDVELRYPGRVHVCITSHDAGGLTDRDGGLARAISQRAAAAGLTAQPQASTRVEVVIGAVDIDRVVPFWAAVLGYRSETAAGSDTVVHTLVDPQGIGPALRFEGRDAATPVGFGRRLNVIVAADEMPGRVAAGMAAGGRVILEIPADTAWVLADPEGTEVGLGVGSDEE
ncbi:MAG: pterin-4-alpha-carbinolamine dehydratase [Acidimicrobiia bacterium]|nr:pterin-4-alpha-carbinolamine dehydratase [Acidimicrobiia bacterium]